jgi:hypothetical protein
MAALSPAPRGRNAASSRVSTGVTCTQTGRRATQFTDHFRGRRTGHDAKCSRSSSRYIRKSNYVVRIIHQTAARLRMSRSIPSDATDATHFHVKPGWRSWQTQRTLSGARLGDRLFLQKKFCGLHSPVGVKPALDNVVAHKICQRKQTHSLMVNHPGLDQFALGPSTRVRVVCCLVESVGAEPSECLHAAQIGK